MAEFWRPRENQKKQNGSNISISVLSFTEWTHRYHKSCN